MNTGWKKWFFGIFLVATFVRLFHFPERLLFGPEQAISLLTSADYLSHKLSLLGQPDLIRNTSTGFTIFQGAWFNYSLVPLQIFFNYHVLPITLFFTILNLATGLLLFFLVKRRLGGETALVASTLFLFNSQMIAHSLFIWILNYLPLLGLIIFHLLSQKKKTLSLPTIFFLGLLCGASFSLEYAFLFIGLILLPYIFFRSSRDLKSLAALFLGLVLPNLPIIIFDLNHNFYHFRTLWQYTLDVFAGSGEVGLAYYHFFSLYPVLFILLALFLVKVIRQPLLIGGFLVCYLVFNLLSPSISFTSAAGMPQGLSLGSVEKVARVIAEDQPGANFNVASLWDFDTRAHPLRYLLTSYHHLSPQPVEEYDTLDALYVFAPADYDLKSAQVWELAAYKPFRVTILISDTTGYSLYKLTK